MQLLPLRDQIALRYGIPCAEAFDAFIFQMNLIPDNAVSCEQFFISLFEQVAKAEASLPEALAQNNFSYTVGEGGNYRARFGTVINAAGYQAVGYGA